MFSRSREMYVYLQAYQPGAEVVAYVSFYRGGVKALETAPVAVVSRDDRLRTVPLRFDVALEELACALELVLVLVPEPAPVLVPVLALVPVPF